MRRLDRTRRRGLTTVAVVVLLIVIVLMSASLVRLTLTYHERTRANERAIQAELLADAGLDRAFARLNAQPDYKGERWEISAESLGLPSRPDDAGPSAVVSIFVEPSESGEARTVRVQADHPPDSSRRVRASRLATIPDDL